MIRPAAHIRRRLLIQHAAAGLKSFRFPRSCSRFPPIWSQPDRRYLSGSHFIILTEAFASFQPLKKVFKQIGSALSLFVFWILANDPDAAFSLDDFAFLADRFYG